MMNLSNLKRSEGATHRRKRIGRGKGSGHGNKSTRGGKGQTARSGKPHPYAGFEGGQMPLVRRVPKRGFKNFNRKEYAIVNLAALEAFDAGTTITPELLIERRLVRKLLDGVKVLGRGDVTKAYTLQVHCVSASARTKIEKAGGKVEVI